MPRKILFIVNPNAGRRMGERMVEMIRESFPANIYYHIAIWRDPAHFDEIIEILRGGDYSEAVAVGGDGTVNRVAKSILGTGIALGILPVGSGNGLARSLGISMKVDEAIGQIIEGNTSSIDVGYVNDYPFFCTSGVGFDAHIGSLFANSVRRGLRTYISITARELLRYRAKSYKIELNGQVLERKAFLVTVANAGQYGNDFYIAPQADLRDGLFHLVILKPFNVFKVFGLMKRILDRKAFMAKSIETFSASHIRISRQSVESIHYDGEPAEAGTVLEYRIESRALKVVAGKGFSA